MRHLTRVEEMGWDSYLGQSDTLVSLRILGRYPVRVQEVLRDATFAMEQALINTGYENPCDYIGSYNVRAIAGTDIWSMHSYGIAIDIDYGGDNPESPDHPGIDKNPHIHRRIVPGDSGFGVEWQILEHQVRAVEAIKNTDGDPVWRWLGWSIGDTMHFEVRVGPQFTTVDWSTVYTGEDDVTIAYNDWVEGWVQGLDEAHVRKLHSAGIITGDVQYWINLLNDPSNPEWRYFYTRAQASTWAKIGEL